MMTRLFQTAIGLYWIALGLLPSAMILAIVFCAWSIVNDVRSYLRAPIESAGQLLVHVRETIETTGDAIGNAVEPIAGVNRKVSDALQAVGGIPTQFTVPPIRIPAASLPVSPNVQVVGGVPRIRMDNASVQMPTIPAFTVQADGLSRAKEVLRNHLSIVADLSGILGGIPNLSGLREGAQALGEGLSELLAGLQRIGLKLLIIVLLTALMIGPWFYATYLLPYLQWTSRSIRKGWRLVIGA